jgi:hypothetical protein
MSDSTVFYDSVFLILPHTLHRITSRDYTELCIKRNKIKCCRRPSYSFRCVSKTETDRLAMSHAICFKDNPLIML